MQAVAAAYYEFQTIVKLWNQWHLTNVKLVLCSSDSYPVNHNGMSHAVSSCPLKRGLACAFHLRTRAEAVWTFQRIFNQLLEHFSHWLEAVHRQLQYFLGQLRLFQVPYRDGRKRNWCFGPWVIIYRHYTFLLIGSSVSCLWRSIRFTTESLGTMRPCHLADELGIPTLGLSMNEQKNLFLENNVFSQYPAHTAEE